MIDSGSPRRTASPASPSESRGEHQVGPGAAEYEPPWRNAWRRVREAWGRGGIVVRVALAIGGVIAGVLIGAFLFGLWHVLVGGLARGNAEAAGFGFALASIAGAMLWIEAAIAQRLLPGSGRGRSAELDGTGGREEPTRDRS